MSTVDTLRSLCDRHGFQVEISTFPEEKVIVKQSGLVVCDVAGPGSVGMAIGLLRMVTGEQKGGTFR